MTRGRLLVLDDDATVGLILVMGAQGVGFEARLCESAEPFFEALASWAPTHVAIDLSLPGISAAQLLRRLSDSGCHAHIIICSGAGRSELDAALSEARSLGLDAAGVLPKPFTLADLRALLGAAR